MFEAKFQSFTDRSERDAAAGRVAALRAELVARGLNGFIVPHADDHQSEYLPANAERLAWLTGFTGSAGRAIVLGERAALFVDGRYTLQARTQTDTGVFEVVLISEQTPEAWMEANLPAGARVGYDPWLHTSGDVEKLSKSSTAAGAELVAVDPNPLDAVWTDR
ncbi:MAG TPA: aminopeptidase P family N-terminal domain-containing protein, partial [Burkholderiales bacterium]|nr:aminopeptidase P family N-terminal domain-containing protein [Burkholderiales bacterium]